MIYNICYSIGILLSALCRGDALNGGFGLVLDGSDVRNTYVPSMGQPFCFGYLNIMREVVGHMVSFDDMYH